MPRGKATLAIAAALLWLSATPLAHADDDTAQYTIEAIHAEVETGVTGEPVLFAITIAEPFHDQGVRLQPDPIELRLVDGEAPPIRPKFVSIGDGEFEASVTFDTPGEWRVVAAPNVASDAESLPLRHLVVTIRVATPVWVGQAVMGVLAVALLAFVVRGPVGDQPRPHGADIWPTPVTLGGADTAALPRRLRSPTVTSPMTSSRAVRRSTG